MKKRFDVAVVGELNADLILRGDIVPEFKQVEKIVANADLVLGSSSAIFACGAARLGLKVTFLGMVGCDPFGEFVLEELKKNGVDTRAVTRNEKVKTGFSVILNRKNDRAILTYSGSIGALRFADLHHETLQSARHLHLGGYYLLDGLRKDVPKLFLEARNHGMTTSLDTNYDPRQKWDGGIQKTLQGTDCFLPNETELCAIAGESTPAKAMQRINKIVPTVVCKLGALGARASHHGDKFTTEGVRVKVVDTVGAGDTFDAGFLYGYLNQWPLQKSLRMACVCGSLSTRKAGGTAGQPNLAEASKYLR
jgi:sugar/nucleoside kinase (ribokinase family)